MRRRPGKTWICPCRCLMPLISPASPRGPDNNTLPTPHPMQNNLQMTMDALGGPIPQIHVDDVPTQVPPQPQRDCDRPLRVIYIAGDGRSGSTLLDRLIGAYPGVFSCGELGNLLQSTASSEQLCACGDRAQACGFWHEVLRRWSVMVPDFTEREYRGLQRRYERLRHLLHPHHDQALTLDDPRFARYAEYTGALFNAIADLSGATVIVDSSKSPARALALSRIPGLEVRMLHLVRDVRGVAYSLRKLSTPKPGDVKAKRPQGGGQLFLRKGAAQDPGPEPVYALRGLHRGSGRDALGGGRAPWRGAHPLYGGRQLPKDPGASGGRQRGPHASCAGHRDR